MFRKALAAAAVAATAVLPMAAPAGAATTAASPTFQAAVGTSSVDRTAASSTQAAPAPGAARANTAYSQITDFFCGRINGTPYVGAQSRQAKYTTNTVKMTQTHVVQGFSGGRWVNLGKQGYVKRYPAGGVWYYAPSTSGDLYWNLSGRTGTFRIKVNFVWTTSTGTIYKATSTSPTCTK